MTVLTNQLKFGSILYFSTQQQSTPDSSSAALLTSLEEKLSMLIDQSEVRLKQYMDERLTAMEDRICAQIQRLMTRDTVDHSLARDADNAAVAKDKDETS